ncbi:TetR/AcrR family transcriptional regulator [Nocardioides aestuarii]|uniref:TetR/AcrR family transcriptional regulator n=1 Tax=Nocardioides aestuarii TaxID=252231 RepID=A0ABW4TMG2_9ACTN
MSQPTSPRTRLRPDQRRAQLLDLGVGLLATRSLDELTIDLLAEEAGISRGLLYHYFGNKHAFHEAVVRRAVDDLVEQTAPPAGGEPLDRLLASMSAYVDYVAANHEGYTSILKAAQGGNEALRGLYDEALASLTDRIFTEDAQGELIADTPAARMVVRAWAAMVEQLVLGWVEDPTTMTRDQLLATVTGSLPAVVSLG